jgi:hypothetical protein
MSFLEIAQFMQQSEFGTALRESQYAFPIVEAIHLLGLAVSFGMVFFTDLRLIGVFFRRIPVSEILHQLRYWVWGGFAVTFITGALLFWCEALTLYANPAFLLKVLFMVIGCVNALVFEVRWGSRVAEWADQAKFPAGARFAGWTSLIFWTLVTIAGRSIPYYPA